MIINTNFQSNTNIKLPLAFILYALLAFVAAQFLLLFHSNLLIDSQFRLPTIWMGAHFLLLGFAAMIAMGAMYQLVPVAFLTPIWSQKLGAIQFSFTLVGITSLSLLLGIKPDIAVYGGILTIIGMVLFIFQMALTIGKQKKKNIITYFVLAAITCFFLTILAGFLLAWNIAYGGISSHNTILTSHITLGVAGWFTLLIFGFSYKLVPMFSLAHGFSMKWAKLAFFSYLVGLLVVIVSFGMQDTTLRTGGWLLLFCGFTFFVLDMKDILSKRLKKRLDKPFMFSLLAIVNGLIIHFIAFMLSLFAVNHLTIWSWLIFLYVMSWIIFSILGYLYKIVPFLWWTFKYADKIGKEQVPNLKDMFNEKWSVLLFILFIVGITGLTAGALVQISMLVFFFQALLAITSLAYASSIVRILFH
ncbi:hypothetical protein [Psychrobacillus sp.]|uniref:hypothetical protein n=1 Tax=Psychrobacillus sp. TaxID=1871623 RepID=UPI0028BDF5AE|nr:hypothetical protein [Psychrobacillus sp.]